MAYGTIVADKITTSDGYTLGGTGATMKNRIINGAMVIDQRNAGAATTPASGNVFCLDRWKTTATQSSKLTIQQNSGSVTPPAGFINYTGVISNSSYTLTSSDHFDFCQNIEGLNTADLAFGGSSAKTITLSFWVRSSLTGAFGGSIQNSAQNRSYPFSYTISAANTWEQKTITIPGDTTGTWLTTNGIGIRCNFSLGAEATVSTTGNAWAAGEFYAPTGSTSVVGTSGATWYITGVQLEAGSQATSFDYRYYGAELALCQRYFWRKSGVASAVVTVGSGMAYNTTDIRCTLVNPVTMRTTPTISFTGSNFEYEKTASSRGTLSSVDATARSVDASALFSGSGTTATTAGQGAIWYITDSASYISISAEI